MKKKTFAMAAGLSMCAGVAYAGSYTTTSPGLHCVEQNASGVGITYSDGAAYNAASGWRAFVCPLPRRALDLDGSEPEPLDSLSWNIWVHDQHPTLNVSCTLFTCGANQIGCQSGQSFSSQTMGVQSIGPSSFVPAGTSTERAWFQCSVPGTSGGLRSGIVSYETEDVSTN